MYEGMKNKMFHFSIIEGMTKINKKASQCKDA
jgi:hypothetical protein